MSAVPKPARVKRKKRPIPINPETGLPFSAGTMKMRLLKRLKCTQKFEKLAWTAGAKLVAGVDEVGRGCLFGPVVAGAVILEPGYRIKGLRDSKLIDRETRETLAERIKQHAIAYAVAAVGIELPTVVWWLTIRFWKATAFHNNALFDFRAGRWAWARAAPISETPSPGSLPLTPPR